MKICVSLAISVLTAITVLSWLPVQGEAAIYDSVIRLHVLAASDAEEDQKLKLQVRDHVLTVLKPLLEETTALEEAATILSNQTEWLEESIAGFLRQQESTDSVKVQLVWEKYPTREYDAFTLPAGEYLSLQVLIGTGEGQNWWCVLFPSICGRFAVQNTANAYAEAGFTPAQYRLITHTDEPKYQIRFRILEILENCFSRRK